MNEAYKQEYGTPVHSTLLDDYGGIVHIERTFTVEAVDKIKLVFISCRYNISWIRKTVFENKYIFAYF